MCIIAFAKNRKVNKEEFKNCFDSNRDGFGLAWRENGRVHFKKGLMDKNEAWKFYNNKKLNGSHVLHFRIGTSGGKTKELTHPFLITKDSPPITNYKGKESLLFHNGVISNWNSKFILYMISSGISPIGNVSDTRALAMITSKIGTEEVEDSKDKIIIFSPQKSLAWGNWENKDGVLFSNGGYKSYTSYYRGTHRGFNSMYRN